MSLPAPLEQKPPHNLVDFHTTNLPMWIFDRKTLTILEANEAATQLHGYSRAELLQLTILDIRPLEDIPKLLQAALRAPGRPAKERDNIWRHRRKDGSIFQVKIRGWEISFDGRSAELVMAEPVKAASASAR